ncbi:MAG: hypothetical protein AAGG75_15625 [Bacteroidota bacterium]
MAIAEVHVTVVDVGQGQCTFVEIYDDSNPRKLVHTLLFDCGSDDLSTKNPKPEIDENLKYMIGKISKMDTPKIDLIVFSHSDNDHISLTRPLLDKFESQKKLIVEMVFYGGNAENYTKNNFNILKYLETNEYCDKGKICGLNPDYTSYNTTEGFTESLWKSPDGTVTVFPLVANVVSGTLSTNTTGEPPQKKIKSEPLNRVSIVCALFYKKICYVICGDATNKTMSAFNQTFQPSQSPPPSLFASNIMTTLPHHGSRTTGLAVTGNKRASDNHVEVVKTFATILQSKTISISSYERHQHPSLELINRFKPPLTAPLIKDPRLQQDDAHRIQCYYDQDLIITAPLITPTKNLSYTFDTQSNIFGTRYSGTDPYLTYNFGSDSAQSASGVNTLQPINSHASWKYTTQANGDTTLVGVPDLQSTKFTESPTTTVLNAPIPLDSRIKMAERITDYAEKQPAPAAAGPTVRIKRKGRPRPARQASRFQQRLIQFS